MRHDDSGKFTARIRGTTPEIQAIAQVMRQDMTPAERRLWESIRNRQLDGLRFRAQHCVGRFVLDFYCPSRKLVIELDGSVHDGEQERDAARTAHLEAFGYRVLRFRNDAVMHELPLVLAAIAAAGESEAPRSPSLGEPEEEAP